MKNTQDMNIINNDNKRNYITPEVAIIKLDNEISLALESYDLDNTPPTPESMNCPNGTKSGMNDPYHFNA